MGRMGLVMWCDVVWCGVVWCGVVWCGVVWCGVVWCGVVCCGVVWCGVVWCGVVWCGVVWCGVVGCQQTLAFVYNSTHFEIPNNAFALVFCASGTLQLITFPLFQGEVHRTIRKLAMERETLDVETQGLTN